MSGLSNPLQCDLRTLALFRLGVGIALIWAMLSDRWIGPTAEGGTPLWAYAPHALARGSIAEDLLFMIGIVAALCITAGYRTRLALLVNWLLLGSLHAAYPDAHQPADSLLMAQSFLGMFLPLNARYAIDSALNREPDSTNLVFSPATAALLVLSALSFAAPAFRNIIAESASGETTPVLIFVAAAIPLVAFLPLWQTAVRTGVIVVMAGVTGAIASHSAGIGPLLPLVAAVGAFVPAGCWDWVSRTPGANRRAALRIYYDRDCGFCLKTCLLFRTFFALGRAPIEAAQETPAIYKIMERHESWVVLDHDGKPFVRWHAVLLLLRRSPIFWLLGRILTAAGMGRWANGFYELIAGNRSALSWLTSHVLPFRPVATQCGGIKGLIAGLWLVMFLALSALNILHPNFSLGPAAASIADTLGLNQTWGDIW